MTQSTGWSRRIGRQDPTFRACPSYSSTFGPECAEFAERGGLHLLPWQRGLLDDWLAVGPDGLWVNPTPGLSVPRQNGKTEGPVLARVAYGLVVLGERIIFTSHRQDAATEFYEALTQFLGSSRYRGFVEPEAFRAALGRERVPARRGNAVAFIARSNKGGRSKHADLVIVDEAQFLTDSQLSSLAPTRNTAANPQTISLGTPPELPSDGEVFRRARQRAHDGEADACWAEWSVDELPEDVSDRDLWYRTNPSLGLLIPEANLEVLRRDMDPVGFAREALGWWAPTVEAGAAALDAEKWDKCRVDGPMAAGKLAFGVKFSPDGQTVAVSWARAERGGRSYVELYDVAGAASGTVGIARTLLANRGEIAAVCVDGKSGTSALVQRLRDGGFPRKAIVPGTPAVMQSAATMLRDEVNAGLLGHVESPALDVSATKSVRRAIGADGWGFGDSSEAIACPIESAALALWAARTTKREPRRVQEASF